MRLTVFQVFKTVMGVLCGALLFLGALQSHAGPKDPSDPPAGLMWNRTGLPAVFPLLVKTPAGRDYYLTLFDAQSGDAALAAFIKGGAFFKVLVPPGSYDLRFASGSRWINEDALFGAGGKTDVFELAEPLTFAIRDLSTKAGHLVEIKEPDQHQMAAVSVSDHFVCQGPRLVSVPRLQPSFDDVESYTLRIPDDGELMRFPPRFSKERLLDGGDAPVFPTRYAPYFSAPEYDIRAHLC
ncbi:hypothetical protein [Roseobacter sp.]|uniref:hypothetical protein n=1 Tax=Roseobacter sp. TaxID=1907202 RepID=UPI0038587CFB